MGVLGVSGAFRCVLEVFHPHGVSNESQWRSRIFQKIAESVKGFPVDFRDVQGCSSGFHDISVPVGFMEFRGVPGNSMGLQLGPGSFRWFRGAL